MDFAVHKNVSGYLDVIDPLCVDMISPMAIDKKRSKSYAQTHSFVLLRYLFDFDMLLQS